MQSITVKMQMSSVYPEEKLQLKDSFDWNLSSEACAGHASSCFGSPPAQCELHLLSRLLKLLCLNTFYSKYGSVSSVSLSGRKWHICTIGRKWQRAATKEVLWNGKSFLENTCWERETSEVCLFLQTSKAGISLCVLSPPLFKYFFFEDFCVCIVAKMNE